MASTIDREVKITPHQLCSLCQTVAENLIPGSSWKRDVKRIRQHSDYHRTLPDINVYWTSREPLKHHTSLSNLRQAAENGCHLCALFVGLLDRSDKKLRLTDQEQPLYIVADTNPVGDTSCSPHFLFLCDEQAAADPQHREALVTSRLHRHTNHDSPPSSSSMFCQTQYNTSIHEPCDTGHKWCKNTGAAAGMQSIARWLQRCSDNHTACSKAFDNHRPTRLLDLRQYLRSDSIRLVLGSEVGPQPYATLSYSWGQCSPVTLRQENYDAFRASISVSQLPKTIREAIEVCRMLAVRYLWVDSLCIIQGDLDDFVREISRMGSFYAGSVFTIAAADSADCDSGCFKDRKPLYREHCRLHADEESLIFVAGERECYMFAHSGETHTLDSRAWVFQERMMSPRTIHFGQSDIVWECREETFCEDCFPTDDTAGSRSVRVLPGTKKGNFIALNKSWETCDATLEWQPIWDSILREYSQTSLSNYNDRLSALAGIAQVGHDKLGLSASFGLWHSFFLDELLWGLVIGTEDFLPEKDTRGALPSWSWAGTKHRIFLFSQSGQHTLTLRLAAVTKLPPASAFAPLSALCSELSCPASVELSGWLVNCRPVPKGSAEWSLISTERDSGDRMRSWEEHLWESIGNRGPSRPIQNLLELSWPSYVERAALENVVFYPDVRLEKSQSLVCCLIRRSSTGTTLTNAGLVLERVHADQNQYRRMGVFREQVEVCDSFALFHGDRIDSIIEIY